LFIIETLLSVKDAVRPKKQLKASSIKYGSVSVRYVRRPWNGRVLLLLLFRELFEMINSVGKNFLPYVLKAH
jgi:hypothetical protein